MDIIKLIKLKELNGDLINLTDKERFIISFFYDLKKDGNLYKKGGVIFFEIYIITDPFGINNTKGISTLYCNYYNVWMPIYQKYKFKNNEISEIIKKLFKTHLDIQIDLVQNKYFYP